MATPALWDWLLDATSLTRRLQHACSGRFHVQVLRQLRRRPAWSEARVLGMRRGECGVVREVRLHCNDAPWVFARTVIPASTLSGVRRRLVRLGSRPLGAALFAQRSMRRGQVQVARLIPGQTMFEHAVQGLAQRPDCIWGRRSVFWIKGRPLLVSEIFLPALVERRV
ncbi:MAG TPA: chorismate lyase [Gammaproteobacteria bacterium]|nr:chorismate lyase [Gammaproteobacteria bacterium]